MRTLASHMSPYSRLESVWSSILRKSSPFAKSDHAEGGKMAGEPGEADCKPSACWGPGHCCKAGPAPASLLTLNSWLVDLAQGFI